MSDRIVLAGMVFQGRHGMLEQEQLTSQPFEVDVDLLLDLQAAGLSDDIAQTVDYAAAFEICRQVVESTSFRLLEALAEALAQELLVAFDVTEVGVRVRKPAVPIEGTIGYAGVEIRRARTGAGRARGRTAPRSRRRVGSG